MLLFKNGIKIRTYTQHHGIPALLCMLCKTLTNHYSVQMLCNLLSVISVIFTIQSRQIKSAAFALLITKYNLGSKAVAYANTLKHKN